MLLIIIFFFVKIGFVGKSEPKTNYLLIIHLASESSQFFTLIIEVCARAVERVKMNVTYSKMFCGRKKEPYRMLISVWH